MSAARRSPAAAKAKRGAGDAKGPGRPAAGGALREHWPGAYERLRADPSFGAVVERIGPVHFEPRAPDAFGFLVRAVTYQQLAGKAAATIHGRLVAALGGAVTPASVLAAPEDELRGAGLSGGKLASIRDLAARVAEGRLELEGLEALDDEAVIERLVTVRGIGRWTAEMALLFHLRRPDVWPVGDLAVRAGAARLFGLAEPPSPRELHLIGLGYRPWRSAVTWYCWRVLDLPATV